MGPMPDNNNSCGDANAPPYRITSRLASIFLAHAVLRISEPGYFLIFNKEFGSVCPRNNVKVGSGKIGRQVAFSGTLSLTIFLSYLKAADTLLIRAIEILAKRKLYLHCRIQKNITDRH